ncbi:MAG TPA: DoxX family protein [Pyrinomonadaceae bacterium]|nr:DoxX family protein [Pyrinomonadaceae bacterium]
MARKIAYWITTSIVVLMMTFAGVTYLMGSPQAVEGFAHMGYPQHVRIALGAAKVLGAVILIVPGLPLVKEWAYAGFAFAWVLAAIGHYLAGDGISSITPLVLLAIMIVSYLTRPPSRRLALSAVPA